MTLRVRPVPQAAREQGAVEAVLYDERTGMVNEGAATSAQHATASRDDTRLNTKLPPVMAITAEAPSRRGTACCRPAA